jgi:Protein of unknown function (DUF1237)
MAICAACQQRPETERDAGWCYSAPVQVHQYRPVCECLQRRCAARWALDEWPYWHEARTAWTQMGNRLALLSLAVGLSLLAGDGWHFGFRCWMAGSHPQHLYYFLSAAAQRGCQSLQIPTQDGACARYAEQWRSGCSCPSGGTHRVLLPPVGRCHNASVPCAFQLLCRHFLAQGCRDSGNSEQGDCPGCRLPCLGRWGGDGFETLCNLQPSWIRYHLCFRGWWFRQSSADGRCQCAQLACHALFGRCRCQWPHLSEYPLFCVERQQSLFLQRQSRRGHRRTAYRLWHGVAHEHYDESLHKPGWCRNQNLHQDADGYGCRYRLYARIVS